MAKIPPAAGALHNRGMAKVLRGAIGLRLFSYPDVQMFASTPVLDYKDGWKLMPSEKSNNLGSFEHVVGCNDRRVLITTRLEVLEYQANSPGKLAIQHKENWNECGQIKGLFFQCSRRANSFQPQVHRVQFLEDHPVRSQKVSYQGKRGS